MEMSDGACELGKNIMFKHQKERRESGGREGRQGEGTTERKQGAKKRDTENNKKICLLLV